MFLSVQTAKPTDDRGSADLSDTPLKRSAEQESSEDDDDIWNKMDVVTSTSKRRKRLTKGIKN